MEGSAKRGRYDPAEILARMRADRDSDWPARLLHAIAGTPAVDRIPSSAFAATRPQLTPAELQVIECASRGLTPTMTAELRSVAPETVKTQLKAVRYKLRAKTTTHAACEALRRGLIS